MRSDDCGVTFNNPVSCPASAPHGPVLLRDGTLIYLGKQAQLPGGGDGMGVAGVVAATSSSNSRTPGRSKNAPSPRVVSITTRPKS